MAIDEMRNPTDFERGQGRADRVTEPMSDQEWWESRQTEPEQDHTPEWRKRLTNRDETGGYTPPVRVGGSEWFR